MRERKRRQRRSQQPPEFCICQTGRCLYAENVGSQAAYLDEPRMARHFSATNFKAFLNNTETEVLPHCSRKGMLRRALRAARTKASSHFPEWD